HILSSQSLTYHTFLPSQPKTYHAVIMVKMVPYEGFACPCGAGDVVLRESYKPKTRDKQYYAGPRSKPLEDTFGCKFFLWKEERVRLLVGSPGASTTPVYSPGSSSTSIYSPGSLTPPRYSPGASTPQSYSMGTSRNVECSNCKHLFDKITTDRDDTKSQTGYVFTLNGGAVVWKSSKQSTTAKHAAEAEYIAVAEAAKEAI
nr:retrotransposon protein putative Ty1-copia subclass [Tanacetum cinerariifolium]